MGTSDRWRGVTNSDAFGRTRVSNPTTLFDSKLLFDNAPLFWDDSEESGSGTSSTHDTDEAAVTMGVGATTAGKRTRQTFMRFNYQPGKSQLVFMTGTLDLTGGGTGITRSVGLFDDNDGVFFRDNEGTLELVRRSSETGSAVDTAVAQSTWNRDAMNGDGISAATLDLTKSQIFVFDFEWLGVGTVRCGLVIDGSIYYVHEFHHANSGEGVYMSTPNLPLRYQIENDGTGAASTMRQVCGTVISEGGAEPTGVTRYKSTEGTHVAATTADTIYAVVGVRLKSTHLDCVAVVEGLTVLAETNDDFEWLLYLNPTVAGTFTYSAETNSCIETATGATANTITGGTVLQGGFANSTAPVVVSTTPSIRPGAAIDGTVDEVVLCARPLSNNANIQGSITWRELS